MKSLLKYFKGYIKECILGPLFKLLEASFELIIPLIVADLIDKGIGYGDNHYIIKMALLMIGFGLVGFVISITAQYYSAKAATAFSTKVRSALFSHIQTLSYTEIDNLGTAGLITRMTSDINQLQNGVNMTLRLFLRSPFVVLGATIMAFTINVKAALIFVITIVLLSIVVFGIMLITIPLYRKVQKGLDKVLGLTRDNLNGVRVIRAFALEDNEIKTFAGENDQYVKIQLLVGRISALLNPLTFAMVNLATAYLIYRGAVKVDTGILTVGQVVALVNYMSQILVELIKFANFIYLDIKALACADRIESVLLIKSSMKEGDKEEGDEGKKGQVVFDHVSLRYDKTQDEAIENISFTAGAGQLIGIIGGTGSGKTSLVNMIPRFYDASKGAVYVDGVDVKDYTYEGLRKRIGIVPQTSVLFAGTIRSNMKWGANDASDEDIYKALKIAQAAEFVKEAGGLDAPVSEGGKNFSGGQRQRLAIARSLVSCPEILILDDSCSALDFATDAALRQGLKEMDNSPTIFLIASRTSSIMKADLIIVLEDGRVDGMGKHEELLKNSSVYQEIYYSQNGGRDNE